MKIDRLIGILMLLINRDKLTAKQLAEHFNVSVRTIQRDMDTLTLAGVPLYAETGSKGGYQLMENYKLSKSYLNKNEADILMTFLKGLEQAAPYSDVKSMINKFDALSENQGSLDKMVIHLTPGLDNDLFKNHLACLSNGRDLTRKVKITYLNIDYKETTRIICPYTLVMYGSVWYVYGYCELRNDFRMFKLFRILSCELLDESFELLELPSPLPWESTIDSRHEVVRIKLEIDKKLQGKLPEYFDPKHMTILEDKILATINFPLDEWVYTLLMGMVPYVKILEPDWLRREFVSRLNKSIVLNNYDI
ncbi:YafY family transcriptional regulator [Acidaminobacter sp. JC074]|uniref:helix-turn-helix transcriptional regulator n=1 Tax=Acidaminobacter sp. JC074 TaxID=2530199 RepID=UPI001F109C92|nr:YafY family protein [Acidaminobacter sp. JC074]MCH4888045.1 YafY family transcriptional regulator [Acidaminobacter sp. JC074]